MKLLNALAIATMAIMTAGTALAGINTDGAPLQLPEPGTLALLAGGVATALLIRRRKK